MAFDLAKLTVRQREAYKLLREGKSNKEMATELNVSLSTVKDCVGRVFRRLGIAPGNGGRRHIVANFEDSLKDTKFECLLAIASLSQRMDRHFGVTTAKDIT
jgi:DNA-binding NarL/FixJ family response regulator